MGVIGGNKLGGINLTAKWGLAKETDAQNFVNENGGKISSFDETMKAAEGEMSNAGR